MQCLLLLTGDPTNCLLHLGFSLDSFPSNVRHTILLSFPTLTAQKLQQRPQIERKCKIYRSLLSGKASFLFWSLPAVDSSGKLGCLSNGLFFLFLYCTRLPILLHRRRFHSFLLVFVLLLFTRILLLSSLFRISFGFTHSPNYVCIQEICHKK